MIRIKAKELFAIEENKLIIDKINPEIEKFINHPYKNGSLKYDIQNKLGKSIINELAGIGEFRDRLFREHSSETETSKEEISRQLIDLLNSEITIEALPVSLSLLIKEECSGFDMALLDKFIADDRI
jgi:hypothetical protein